MYLYCLASLDSFGKTVLVGLAAGGLELCFAIQSLHRHTRLVKLLRIGGPQKPSLTLVLQEDIGGPQKSNSTLAAPEDNRSLRSTGCSIHRTD